MSEAEAPVPIDASGEEIMQQEVALDPSQARGTSSIADFYEIEETASFIASEARDQTSFTVALQFPNELLPDASSVVSQLDAALTFKTPPEVQVDLFVLADTSYGSCCVDEVAAQHVNADLIVHYGSACLSRTQRLPVRYCFGRAQLDVGGVAQVLGENASALDSVEQRVVVFYDFTLAHKQHELAEALGALPEPFQVSVARVDPERRTNSEPATTDDDELVSVPICGYDVRLPPAVASAVNPLKEAGVAIVFLGGEGSTLTNLMFNCVGVPVFSIDPSSLSFRAENSSVNRALGRRFYLVQKAKDAEIIGIVAGTLGVSRYLDMIRHVKRVIRDAGKRSYLFLVGKINEPKLANFAEVDIYVNVACPFNSLIDTRDQFKDVITPLELELALVPGRDWTGDYSTHFADVLDEGRLQTSDATRVEAQGDDHIHGTRYSLVTGKLMPLRHGKGGTSSALVAQQSGQVIARSASDALRERTFKGLDPAFGQTPVAKVEMGLSGIAKGYEDERELATQPPPSVRAAEYRPKPRNRAPVQARSSLPSDDDDDEEDDDNDDDDSSGDDNDGGVWDLLAS